MTFCILLESVVSSSRTYRLVVCIKENFFESNGKFVLKIVSVSSRQKQKLSRQNCLLNLNRLNNLF